MRHYLLAEQQPADAVSAATVALAWVVTWIANKLSRPAVAANSYTAQTPSGPWQRKDVAVPLWAHCATAAAVPNKTGTTLIMTHMSKRATARKCLASGCCEGGASPCGMKHPCNGTDRERGPVGAREGAPHTGSLWPSPPLQNLRTKRRNI